MDLSSERLATIHARRETAKEWFQADPKTTKDIENYYRHSEALPAELEAWHQEPDRRSWTDQLVTLAKQASRRCAIDIGCGLGYELVALRDAGLAVCGVEPNMAMRKHVQDQHIPCYAGFDKLSDFDLVICLDVLEHLKNPQMMLARITRLVLPGTLMIEHTPTWDLADPLHLVENYGWRVIEHIGPLWRRLPASSEDVGIWLRL